MKSNDYYVIACNDLLFLQNALNTKYYNQIAVYAQQVAEKMLKSVAERSCMDIEKLMHSHNLRGLYTEIHKNDSSFVLDKGELSILKDMYFDAKYPGDNYVEVDRETCQECLAIMYATVKMTNIFRRKHDLECFEYKELYLEDDNECTEIHAF